MNSIFESTVSFVQDFAKFVSTTVLKKTVDSFSRLHSVDTEFAFIADNGALVSIIRIRGVNTIVGEAEYESIHSNLANALAPYMRDFGHLLQWTHFDDPALFLQELERVTAPYEQAALSHGLDFEDILRERRERIAKFCSTEWTYLAIWTYPDVMSPHEKRRAARDRDSERKIAKQKGESVGAHSWHTQQRQSAPQPLRERHQSLVSKVNKEFAQARMRSGAGYITQLLDVDEAAALIKSTFDSTLPVHQFKLFSKRTVAPIRLVRAPRDDRGVLCPLVREQLFTVTAEDTAVDVARIGSRYVASVSIQVGPMERVSFDRLVSACKGAGKGMPWRVTINMSGGGLGKIVFRNVAASLFGSMDANKHTRDAINSLEERGQAGLPNVAMQVTASTWAPDLETARHRGAGLARAIQSWGICTPSDWSGDAVEDAMSSVGGARDQMPANFCVLPLEEVTKTLPMRPTSPWPHGALLTRTADGRLMPMQPGQQIQQVAIEGVFSPPGRGKSVYMNARHFAALLSLRALSLPFISILDVGPSSKGLIEIISSRLAPHLAHLAVYAKIRNDAYDPSCRINPFDLHLGFRKPLARDRDTNVNILSLLLTPAGGKVPDEGVELASTLVDYLFRRFGDRDTKSAKVYEPSLSPQVAAAIESSAVKLPPRASWYEVVDLLFQKGRFVEAGVAQRYAVPVIQDVLAALKSTEITAIYGSRQGLLDQAYRMIQSAINDYPILSQPTTFDISSARIVSLDLDEVARGSGDSGSKLASLCYMLGFTVATKRFNLRGDDLLPDCVPYMYHDWWMREIHEVTSAPMQLTFDEFHRTNGLVQAQRQAEIECREGRKRGINVMIASQSVGDVPDVIVKELMNGIYLLGGPPGWVDECAVKFDLSETQRTAVGRYCLGPSSEGSAMLAIHETSVGRSSQLVTLTLGPVELWAYSTSPDDNRLRERVMALLGTRDSLNALAKAFPAGSAKDLIEIRERNSRNLGAGNGVDVIGQIAKEVVDAFRR